MTMKRMMKIGVASLALLASATMLHADEAFDQLKALAATPAEKLTKENAVSVLDACIATTNTATAYKIVDAKLLSFAEIFAKTKSNKQFFNITRIAALNLGTEAEYAEAFNDFIDTWITLDVDSETASCDNIACYCVKSWKNQKFIDAGLAKAAAAKIAESNAPLKWNGVASIVYIYPNSAYFKGRLEDVGEQYKDAVKTAILNGEFYLIKWQYFDFISYLRGLAQDPESAKSILDVKWWAHFSKSKNNAPFLTLWPFTDLEPNLSVVRREYLKIAENDFQLMTVAKRQDKTDGNKKTTESIYAKLSEPKNKVDVALYLGDNDKLVEALTTIDNSLDAETINKAIVIINALDPDWRAADVLKALRVINKKYTLKLYDDRDTWEPVLSKVRALIDTYNN